MLKEDVLRENQDVLILSELDRLGRNKREILKELEFYRDRGIRVMILELPTTLVDIDIADPLGKLIFETIQNMVIELYACLAQAEVEKKDKRQREGIVIAKEQGKYKGRKPIVSSEFEQVTARWRSGTITAAEAMRMLLEDPSASAALVELSRRYALALASVIALLDVLPPILRFLRYHRNGIQELYACAVKIQIAFRTTQRHGMIGIPETIIAFQILITASFFKGEQKIRIIVVDCFYII